MIDEKVCTHCGVPKPVPEGFQRISVNRLGTWKLHSWCRACCKSDSAERQRTPLGKLLNQLHVSRWRLRRAQRERTRARLTARIAQLEAEIGSLRGEGT
jgi:hypothetical protein